MERKNQQNFNFETLSKKLNVLISLNLRLLTGDKNFEKNNKRKQGAGALANYFSSFDLDPKDIAKILGAPLPSIRTLLTPKRRK